MSDLIPDNNNFILYTAPSGNVKLEAYIQDETIWLTQQKMADVFGMDKIVVTKHLKNFYKENNYKDMQLVQNMLIILLNR